MAVPLRKAIGGYSGGIPAGLASSARLSRHVAVPGYLCSAVARLAEAISLGLMLRRSVVWPHATYGRALARPFLLYAVHVRQLGGESPLPT